MKVAIAIPQIFSAPEVDRAGLQAFLARVEALGYDGAWVQEQPLGAAGSLEPVALLAYATALTRTVRLGVAVLLTNLRSPVQLAKSLATVDQLSGGRLIVGVGLGGNTRIYPAYGITAERRVRRFTEGLALMKRLWTEERVTFEGEFWRLDNAAMAPRPVQRSHPPIWFGAWHPDALRRAVALGDGFIGAGSVSTADFREQAAHLRALLAETGRDPAAFPVGKRVYLAVDRDRAGAMARMREWFGWYYGNAALAERVAVVGEPQACIDGLREVRDAGAGLILLNPVFEETRHLDLLASEIVPALR